MCDYGGCFSEDPQLQHMNMNLFQQSRVENRCWFLMGQQWEERHFFALASVGGWFCALVHKRMGVQPEDGSHHGKGQTNPRKIKNRERHPLRFESTIELLGASGNDVTCINQSWYQREGINNKWLEFFF